MLKAFVSFFNEISTKKKKYAQYLSLIMTSKRTMLWKEYMSRDKCHPWLLGDLCYMEEKHFGMNTC
jgi:hypothetical protein